MKTLYAYRFTTDPFGGAIDHGWEPFLVTGDSGGSGTWLRRPLKSEHRHITSESAVDFTYLLDECLKDGWQTATEPMKSDGRWEVILVRPWPYTEAA